MSTVKFCIIIDEKKFANELYIIIFLYLDNLSDRRNMQINYTYIWKLVMWLRCNFSIYVIHVYLDILGVFFLYHGWFPFLFYLGF